MELDYIKIKIEILYKLRAQPFHENFKLIHIHTLHSRSSVFSNKIVSAVFVSKTSTLQSLQQKQSRYDIIGEN
jgi:hypothetical protein